MAVKPLLRIVTVYMLITISTAELQAFSNDVGLKVLRIKFGLYISGASSGACLGHHLGHVWGMSGTTSGAYC